MGILGMHDEEQIGAEKVKASHAGGYLANDDIDLVAIADVDEEKLATFGEAWDIPEENQYLGHQDMLAECDLDVISVCTPSYLHKNHTSLKVRNLKRIPTLSGARSLSRLAFRMQKR